MTAETTWLASILGAPLVAALLLLLLRGRVVRAAGRIAGLAAAIPVIGAFALLPALRAGSSPALSMRWIPAANVNLSMRVDWLTLPFLVLAAAVALFAVVYAWGYHRRDERTPLFYALLLLFAAGMIGTTLAAGAFLFYVFWELMLVASCVLVAAWGEGERRSSVALQYFIFTHLGSLMVLVGLLVLYTGAGDDGFSALQASAALPPGQVTLATALFVAGFCVKMAIFPLHLWLPDTHAVAPMPVTIMLAAAMLSMGTYGILRFPFTMFSPAQVAPFAVPMMVAGVVSEIYGALMALAEQDVKRIVAYSSVSQMGYVLFGLGTLTRDGIAGAVLHVVFHAIVKALLFMGVGLVMHATGRRRITQLGGLGRAMPLAAICTGVGALAIAGTPPLCLFDSEWMIFAGAFGTAHIGLSVASLFGSLLSVGYALWFVGRIFLGARPEGLEVKRSPATMVVPAVLLAALALVIGLFPSPVFDWTSRALGTILGGHW
jgi:NADH-quinone oxidoreductase subunit M